MENDGNIFLLFMNLLLNTDLPGQRLYPNRCFFLGHSGCILKIRPVICVNYLCLDLRELLPLEKLISLQHAQGNEIIKSFELEEALKALINQRAGSVPANAGIF
jgi:Fe-S-cluster containining protein